MTDRADDSPAAVSGTTMLLDTNPIVGAPKRGARRFWTNREIALVREHYPAGGLAACLPHLPGRTAGSIYQRAGLLGLYAPAGTPFEQRERIPTSPAIDEAISRWHSSGATRDGMVQLIRSTMRPRRWLTNRAKRLGFSAPRYRPAPWTDEEDQILRAYAGKPTSTSVAALRRAGFRRTETAVIVRLARLHISRRIEDGFTASDLAELLGVDVKAVTGWIEKGWLKASRINAVPGSPYRIKPSAIRSFVVDNVAALKLGRVDPHWFVDMLAHP